MVKRIIIGALLIVLVGAVGVGAYDAYQGRSTFELPDLNLNQLTGGGQGQGGQGGQGQHQGQGGQGGQGGGGGTQQVMQADWETLTGTVVSADAQNMVVDTAEQGELSLMLGEAGFAETQGVTFTPGDAVTVLGFTGEDGTFQAGQITNDTTGAVLMLRDPNGRPLWAGPGRGQGGNGGGGQGKGNGGGNGGGGQGKGQGGNGNGQGQGQGGGQPLAAANDWVTVQGTVTAAGQGLSVSTAEYGELTLQLGPPWFASQQAVTFNVGDSVAILGFSGEGSAFQAGQITNDTTGAVLMLRDPNGRPMWAGQGGSGGGHSTN